MHSHLGSGNSAGLKEGWNAGLPVRYAHNITCFAVRCGLHSMSMIRPFVVHNSPLLALVLSKVC